MRRIRVLALAYRLTLLPLLLTAMLGLAGCDDGKLPLHDVTGTILVDGKPAPGARAIFCPVDTSSPELARVRPMGVTGPDGKYTLMTFAKGDGVPAGEYKVVVQWPSTSGGDERGPIYGPDRLKGKYATVESTTLTASITDETTEIPPLELTSR